MQELNDTAHKILDVAETYTQTNGFNAFSYKDIQNQVGVKTSSIHYYFPTKQDLALSMTERYVERFREQLRSMEKSERDGLKRLEAIGALYVSTVADGKFCMCGMLASDMLSLPDVVNSKLCEFFRLNEEWIADALELGKEQGNIRSSLDAKLSASHYLSVLEGGMLIARAQQRPNYLEVVIKSVLEQFQE